MERIDYRYSFLYNCSTKKTNLNRVQKLWLVVLQEHENMAACTQRLGDNNISVTILGRTSAGCEIKEIRCLIFMRNCRQRDNVVSV